jgi:cytochrome c
MKAIFVGMVASIGLMVTGSVLAADMPAVGKTKCGACHAIDKKMVGPAWNDVAKKYKGDANAASKIAANITKGGDFGWKMSKMPPKGMGASDAEIKSLAEFIVGLK